MSNIVSVVTAAHAPNAKYLPHAYESLAQQVLPDGWEWEWLVQEDGETGEVGAALSMDDPRISLGMARAGGPAVARTNTLTRARGSLIKTFDSDDLFADSGALARDIATLSENPEIGWTTSSALDLLPNGEVVSWEHADPDEGILPKGFILDFWRQNDWRLPVHPMTMCMRRELVIALGGWMALTTAEDTALLMAASVISDGYFIGRPSVLYRKHPQQVTAQGYHTDPAPMQARRLLIIERAEILARMLAT
ncbi:glycosyltransferase family 2 protein [Micromonospora sp. NPDC047465]|uniref:glycosyltransferase family 2 protein n=1 Tax=Micromonospora sp. NPDC047465 TaxID=3154813 RepID=UPI0033C7E330